MKVKLCECGCREVVKFGNRFIHGHNHRGKIGEKHNRWKGKITISDGYLYEYCPDHPKANKEGRVAQHTLVMEEYLDRYLEDGELAHHIDEIRNHNWIENLELCLDGPHRSYHHKGKKRSDISKQKMRKPKSEKHRRKFLGRKFSTEAIQKMSEKRKSWWAKKRETEYSQELGVDIQKADKEVTEDILTIKESLGW